jgi:hypothetical protein
LNSKPKIIFELEWCIDLGLIILAKGKKRKEKKKP